MRIAITKPLFAWDSLEDSPSLHTIRQLLASLPDGRLLQGLREFRGRGRDDYPVSVLWGVVLLRILLRHVSFEAVLAELRRNAGLAALIGISSEKEVPKAWNVSRFLEGLGREPHRSHLREMFAEMVRRLGQVVPDLGRNTAGDSTALHARGTHNAKTVAAETAAGLPQPTAGRKEYTDDQGNVAAIVEWFGYKLHLLVDARHEVALAYETTSAHAPDGATVPALVAQAQAMLPADRIQTLAYDKAADDGHVHAALAAAKIRPVIENRRLWKDEPERLLPGHDGTTNVVYDEAGTLYCYDRTGETPVKHEMSYIGYEPQRQTIKYRCPARHEGWHCPSEAICNADKEYGKTVRVDCTLDLRRFPPIPRATKKFERLYAGRTSVERVNARLKIFWGVDDGNIRGARRFAGMIGTVMVVHVAFATALAAAPRRDGTLGKLRLGPIQEALQAACRSRS
ncbi:MAG TPA: transposase [Sedimentisphaerales bacterium]|nr:transposase [Sedimentisphaerales bacterium]HQG48282.1 transposase [Sedimentisphaerales bacterium]